MSLFHWAMRHAAGLLFAAALLLFVGSLVPFLLEFGGSMSRAPSNYISDTGPIWVRLLTLFVGSLGAPVWPLFGAAVIYRFDRREQVRATFGASDD